VLLANAIAQRHGIQAGISVSSAYALAHDLRVVARDARAEHAALEHLAAWAGQFTSLVNLAPPLDIVLEIGGSLRLYRGLPRLQRALRDGLTQLGYGAALAIAPTPLAATWLARTQQNLRITEIARLTGVLAELPLHCAAFTEKQIQLLHGMGVQRLGDCLRLPRDGFARRLGDDTLRTLDRALGKLPDPRLPYTPPPRYQGHVALPSPVHSTEALLFALQRLLHELHGVLSAQAWGTQRLVLLLKHPKHGSELLPSAVMPAEAGIPKNTKPLDSRMRGNDGKRVERIAPKHRTSPTTRIELKLVAPARDVKHLLDLFRERLQRVQLPDDVEALTLRAQDFVPLASSTHDFFATKGDAQHSAAALIERLQARLGSEAVHSLSAVAEHRPEYAWRYSAPGEALQPAYFKQRPVWLLPQPLPLQERDGAPCFDGALQLEPDRERIESGWWDEHDIARDYFIAHNARGMNLWVFRELTGARRWMLHGVFG
jgi:protein ImuB